MKNPILLMTETAGELNVTGPSAKAPSYFGYANGTCTVCWYLNDFTGRVYIEASLATNPQSTDWFPISLTLNPYVQYPQIPTAPTGGTGDNGIASYTFQANLVWIRMRVDRSYLQSPNVNDVGSIDRAFLNY